MGERAQKNKGTYPHAKKKKKSMALFPTNRQIM
jgi:hypothetical protein